MKDSSGEVTWYKQSPHSDPRKLHHLYRYSNDLQL